MKCMFAYSSLETSRYKRMGTLFAICTNVSFALDGHDGQIQLLVHMRDKVDLEIFSTIVGRYKASVNDMIESASNRKLRN